MVSHVLHQDTLARHASMRQREREWGGERNEKWFIYSDVYKYVYHSFAGLAEDRPRGIPVSSLVSHIFPPTT